MGGVYQASYITVAVSAADVEARGSDSGAQRALFSLPGPPVRRGLPLVSEPQAKPGPGKLA